MIVTCSLKLRSLSFRAGCVTPSAIRHLSCSSIRRDSTDALLRKAARDSQRDFILSVLEAQPSARDSRFYLNAFAPPSPAENSRVLPTEPRSQPKETGPAPSQETFADSLLNSVVQHTGLVKFQGPFNDRQLASICNAMIYLRKLGLVSIVIVDIDGWSPEQPGAKQRMLREAMRIADMFEEQGGLARPLLGPVLRRTSKPNTYALDNVASLRSAISAGETPIVAPLALETGNQIVCVSANDLMPGLAAGLQNADLEDPANAAILDLTPLRVMVINKEGAIPSHARGGTPHLSINLKSEYDFICKTFEWQETHPTALSNLQMMRDCLAILPRTSSAIIVSHRSPRSLVANLVTNKPAFSPSLHRSSFPSHVKLEHTPTILRHGLTIKVHRSLQDVNLQALTSLLESSFGRILDADAYYERLRKDLDFLIVAGDCAAVAIVTKEGPQRDVSYLDKFAILPSLQGDGTVDFMWGALRDETFGLGLLDALNNNGGLEGRGTPVDLVWRSRANNPVNKWYFERSNGFAKLPEMGKGGTPGMLFWCDAEKRVESYHGGTEEDRNQFISLDEAARLEKWNTVVGGIASAWKK